MSLSMYQALSSGLRGDAHQSRRDPGKSRGLCQGAQDRRKRPAQLALCSRHVPLDPPGADRDRLRQGHHGAARSRGRSQYADDEASFAALRQRIAKTQTFVEAFRPADIDGSEGRDITLSAGSREFNFKGQPYLLHFALPNFYFHVTTAYDLLRACGVGIGKMDYIGAI